MPKKRTLKTIIYIEPFSFATVFMIILAFFGLIDGILYSQAEFTITGTTMQPGAVLILLVPAIYAILGFVFGVIIANLYNIVAKKIHGIKIELK